MVIVLESTTSLYSKSELLAWQRMAQCLPVNPYYVYIAFPWSKKQSDQMAFKALQHKVAKECFGKVVSYTDGKLSLALLQLMEQLGVTDLYCSDFKLNSFSCQTRIRLYPAPTYPVDDRDEYWEYQGVRFGRVLSNESSQRLWHYIENDIIPVLSLHTMAVPGLQALWRVAAVSCSENRTATRALQSELKQIASDIELVQQKKSALKQLAFLYGKESFIYDLLLSAAHSECYYNCKIRVLQTYIKELALLSDSASRKTLLTLIKSNILLNSEIASLSLSFGSTRTDFMAAAMTLREQEKEDLQQFALSTHCPWLSELLDEA